MFLDEAGFGLIAGRAKLVCGSPWGVPVVSNTPVQVH